MSKAQSFSRRGFLRRSGWWAATPLAAPHLIRSGDPLAQPGQSPRHIIMLISDGMSAGTLTCADHLSQLTRGRGTVWMELFKHPRAHVGLMNMRSLDSMVTDSSAASSSWGSGSRIANGAVNVLPDGRALKPLYSILAEAGWKRGLVTTTEITHATPAGFAANDDSRGSAENIARQYLERRVDVLLGGGQKFYDPQKRKDKADLWQEYRAAGYCVMMAADDLKKAPPDQRWLGTFHESHLPFTVDHVHDAELMAKVPTLPEMTRAALARLEKENHFILQVEGGRVDHGCHACDAPAALYDQLAFDEAIEVCLEFQKRSPETLVVITTDHGNGNLGLNGMGKNYADSSPLFANLKSAKASFDAILKKLGTAPEITVIQEVIREATGYSLSESKAALLVPFLAKKGETLYDLMNSASAQLGQLLANHWGIGWTGNAHTADYVNIVAIGPGAERFRGFIQNTDVFHKFLALAEIDFKNPEVPLKAKMEPNPGRHDAIAWHWRETHSA